MDRYAEVCTLQLSYTTTCTTISTESRIPVPHNVLYLYVVYLLIAIRDWESKEKTEKHMEPSEADNYTVAAGC